MSQYRPGCDEPTKKRNVRAATKKEKEEEESVRFGKARIQAAMRRRF